MVAGTYTSTSTQLASEAGALPSTVVAYADAGLLDHIRLPNGVRLFRDGQAERVREIRARNIASRGRRGADRASA